MKKALYLGAGLIIGSAATIYLLNKTKVENQFKQSKQDLTTDESITKIVLNQEEPVYDDIKNSTIENFYSRHSDATNIMKDSIEVIRENVKVSENTNKEINAISAELDKLLGED